MYVRVPSREEAVRLDQIAPSMSKCLRVLVGNRKNENVTNGVWYPCILKAPEFMVGFAHSR